MPKQHVQLTPTDRDTLTALITKGDQKARIYKRALGLLELDRGKTYTQVAQTLGMTGQTLSNWAKEIPHPWLGWPQRCPAARTPGGDDRQATGPKSPPWPVQPPRQAMADGHCASWRITAWHWAIVSISHTRMSRRF